MAPINGHIDKRDFDANRPLLGDSSQGRRLSDLDDDGLMDDVVDGIIERDRQKMKLMITRYFSFFCAILSCLCAGSITAYSLYGGLFLTRLHYTQLRVNAVSITAELAMYLPVPVWGYLCDRYSPPPLSLLASVLFGFGYFLAAFTYKSGPPSDTGAGQGWPFGVMILAFVGIGSGTSCMYLSAIATCAKNFGNGKHKGLFLALPTAAFGLSGMWQSQIGTHLLSERNPDGSKGDVDVHRYFLFLGGLLMAVGLVGSLGLKIVGEEDRIDEAVEELERSGLLEESEFFRPSYGATTTQYDDNDDDSISDEERETKRRAEEEERRKKSWLLNYESRRYLTDSTMWWLAAGFFLVTGPGEAFINNLGTIIPTLTPPDSPPSSMPPAGLASTHVSIIALTSTIARLLTGTLSDVFAPSAQPDSNRWTFSRMFFLLPSAFLLALGYFLLGTPLVAIHPPLFHLTSVLVGLGYGATFSLVPIIISVVWGVENFATNWGIVAMMPAGGAAVWSLVYTIGYTTGSDGKCHGMGCYVGWAWGCFVSALVAIPLWYLAWKGWRKRGVIV